MKSTKVFKFKEFNAACEASSHSIQVQEVKKDSISIQAAEPLYECNVSQPHHKIENAVIVLPYTIKGKATVDSLSLTLTRYVSKQQAQGDSGFSLGRFFVGDYRSGESVWNEKSLCVSLYGVISDRAGTIATAEEIMRIFDLPKILILNEAGALEITRDASQSKPQPHRIKRLGN